ncbi:TetR/AcrR family transcriptional regulator [Mammaliicoccus sciuri]|uniref:TetR/AcrR family transcriptional regulator n=1 Tax=Mammaliicoccus sciuri TaxID=1296 RepID=UPI003F55B9D2
MIKQKRRYSNQLKKEIYNITYELINTEGYRSVNFSTIANYARTSRSVMYRYWETKHDLLIDTIIYQVENTKSNLNNLNFDKGNMRDNLIFVGYKFIEEVKSPPFSYINLLCNDDTLIYNCKLFPKIRASNIKTMDYIFNLAIHKGEISKIPPDIVKLTYFQLLRSTSLKNNNTIFKYSVVEIVDDIIIPSIKYCK